MKFAKQPGQETLRVFKKNLRQKSQLFKTLFLSFILLTTLWAASMIYCTIGLSQNLDEIEVMFQWDDASDLDLDLVGVILPDLARNLKGLRYLTRPLVPVLKLGSFLPGIGAPISQADPLLRYAAHMSEAANLTYEVIYPFGEFLQTDPATSDFTQYFYKILSDGQPSMDQAARALDEARKARQEIDPALFPTEIKEGFLRVDAIFENARLGVHLAAVLPEILGSIEQPRSYLLLAQNRDELRATGGFISGIGWVQVGSGEILTIEIGDSYLVDDFSKNYPPPPEPLQRFMQAGYWVPRDANWSPDFPTAAQKNQELYTLSTGISTDGVIAFDQDAVRSLVKVLGPFQIASFPETITAENIETTMQQAWQPKDGTLNQEWWVHRKDFMPQLMEALVSALMDIRDQDVLEELSSELLESIRSGHILLYFNQPDPQSVLVQAGLDNGIHPGEGDFLMVVDSNLGFNKTDAVVERRVSYFVDLTNPQKIPAMLIVYYTHSITQEVLCEHQSSYGSGVYTDMQARCYWDFWRVYTRVGTRLYQANTDPISGEWLLSGEDWPGEVNTTTGEGNSQVISGFMLLPTNEQKAVALQLLLPSQVIKQGDDNQLLYLLRIQKQAGLSVLPFVLQIKPPEGYQLKPPDSDWDFDEQTGFWIWSGQIINPWEIELVFTPSAPAR